MNSENSILTRETVTYMKQDLEMLETYLPEMKDNVIIVSLPGFIVYYARQDDSEKAEDFYGKNHFWINKPKCRSYTINNTRKFAFYETKADVFRELLKQADEQDKMLAVLAHNEELPTYPDGSQYVRYTFVDKHYNEQAKDKKDETK